MAKVSLCMIVRDEESRLGACLESVRDLAAEIVVADTGSRDGTKAVAQRYGTRVIDFPWTDDFAAARNAALREARGEWIFWMDADDRLDEANRERLRALIAGLPGGAGEGEVADAKVAYQMTSMSERDGRRAAIAHVRLFRNVPEVQWRGRVHEQVAETLVKAGYTLKATDVVIEHLGYVDPAERRRKLERNCRLLEMEWKEISAGDGEAGSVLYNLGRTLQGLGRWEEAAEALRTCLARSVGRDRASYLREVHWRLASGYQQMGREAEALAACRAGRAAHGDDASLCFLEATLCDAAGDLSLAEKILRDLLTKGKDWYFTPGGVTLVEARQNLGVIYRRTKRDAEAEAQWKRVTRDDPGFAPAWAALGDLYAAQKRWQEALDALKHAAEQPPAAGRGDALRRQVRQQLVRAFAALQRRPEALAACREGRTEFGDDARLCFIEAQLRLAQGDLEGAERALRELLDPGRRWTSVDEGLTGFTARHCLGMVHIKRGQAAEAETAWRQVVREKPDYVGGWISLGELYARLQRWTEADEAVRSLERLEGGKDHAARLRTEIAMARAGGKR